MEGEKIRIYVKSYDCAVLDRVVADIVETAKKTGAFVSGPIPMRTKRRVICILKSPHIYKDSREIFEMRIHKRIIDISTSKKTVDYLLDLIVPSGVYIVIKLNAGKKSLSESKSTLRSKRRKKIKN